MDGLVQFEHTIRTTATTTPSRKAHARPTAPKLDMIDAMMTAAAAPRGDGA